MLSVKKMKIKNSDQSYKSHNEYNIDIATLLPHVYTVSNHYVCIFCISVHR